MLTINSVSTSGNVIFTIIFESESLSHKSKRASAVKGAESWRRVVIKCKTKSQQRSSNPQKRRHFKSFLFPFFILSFPLLPFLFSSFRAFWSVLEVSTSETEDRKTFLKSQTGTSPEKKDFFSLLLISRIVEKAFKTSPKKKKSRSKRSSSRRNKFDKLVLTGLGQGQGKRKTRFPGRKVGNQLQGIPEQRTEPKEVFSADSANKEKSTSFPRLSK